MARPRRGVRGPEPSRGAPGMGGRSRGAGDDMLEGRDDEGASREDCSASIPKDGRCGKSGNMLAPLVST